MPSHVVVEAATPDELDEVLALWLAARVEQGLAPERATRSRVARALDDPSVQVFIARAGGVPVGMVSAACSALSGLGESSGLWVDVLFVLPASRRRGIARHLLVAVERAAEARGLDQVVVLPPTQSRETNRFLARLGFASRSTLRVASADALRRRLRPQDDAARDRLLARRRIMRSRREEVRLQEPVA